MIYVTNTPNNAGVSIHGDYQDFDQLYDALYAIVGDEGEFLSHYSARTRVLGVCYDIRHAIMGDREVEYVDNGMDEEKMKRLSMITPKQNIYFKIEVLWPEMLFVTMALNDFIMLNRKKCKHPEWDKTTAAVRKLQAGVAECLQQTVSEASYKRMLNKMIRDYTWMDDYFTQYLDLLNSKFLAMDKEKRLSNISSMSKRLAEKGTEYQAVKRDVTEAAQNYNCDVTEIRLDIEHSEDIDW